MPLRTLALDQGCGPDSTCGVRGALRAHTSHIHPPVVHIVARVAQAVRRDGVTAKGHHGVRRALRAIVCGVRLLGACAPDGIYALSGHCVQAVPPPHRKYDTSQTQSSNAVAPEEAVLVLGGQKMQGGVEVPPPPAFQAPLWQTQSSAESAPAVELPCPQEID
eukprot:1384994-Rhodomonas_salina.2